MKNIFLGALFFTAGLCGMEERRLLIEPEGDSIARLSRDATILFSESNRNLLYTYYAPGQVARVIETLALQGDNDYLHLASLCVRQHEGSNLDGRREALEGVCVNRCLSLLIKKDRKVTSNKQKQLFLYECGACSCVAIMATEVLCFLFLISGLWG